MNIQSIALVAAVLGVTVAPALASAQTTAPVTIINSTAQPLVQDGSYPQTGSASVSFVNSSGAAATEVDFTLSSNGEPLALLRDAGTFSPNVTVNHTFATDQTARDLQLSVARVMFADGTVWVNDAALPLGRRAVNPWLTTGAF